MGDTLHYVTVVTIVSGTNVLDFSKNNFFSKEGKVLSQSCKINYDFHMCLVFIECHVFFQCDEDGEFTGITTEMFVESWVMHFRRSRLCSEPCQYTGIQ